MVDSKPLLDQVALVTGASRGIGLAIARRLGRMGGRVAICARNEAALGEAVRSLQAEGIAALARAADVTRSEQVAALVQHIESHLGAADILVNNAGIGVFGSTHQLSEADWDRVMDTNLKAVFLVSKAVTPQMIRRRSGHIINISSRERTRSQAGGCIAHRSGAYRG